jgi:hypothetical protein
MVPHEGKNKPEFIRVSKKFLTNYSYDLIDAVRPHNEITFNLAGIIF